MNYFRKNAVRQKLAMQRPMISLIEREMASGSEDFVFDKSNWVPLFYDLKNKVTSDCGTMTAYRALTLRDQFLWMVFSETRKHGFHADCDDPFDAFDLAVASWGRRRLIRCNWELVEKTASDLIWGRKRFSVRIEDAQRSPLCTLGIEGFMKSVGIGGAKRISGRLAALLMKVEPQVGFVIFEAMERQASKAQPSRKSSLALQKN